MKKSLPQNKPQNKPKKLPRKKIDDKKLIAEADKLCREYVFARDGYRCVLCGATDSLQWSHLISRVKTATRWIPENSTCMCMRCHYKHHKQGPEEYVLWYIHTYGLESYEELVRLSKQPVKRAAEAARWIAEYKLKK